MRLRALGTGTCVHAQGTALRLPPLFALDVSETAAPAWILFDCSEGARWRLADAGVDPLAVAHVALSHPHPDHAALPQFVQARACEVIFGRAVGRDLPLTLYLPAQSAAALADLWRWHAPEDGGVPTTRFALRTVGVEDGFREEVLPGVWLSARAVVHGGAPAVAWRVESSAGVFAYSGDSGVCDALVDVAQDADLFLCEAAARVGAGDAMRGRHLRPCDAGEIARRAGARSLLLTHYDGRDDDDAMRGDARASGYRGAVGIARDGDSVEIARGA